MSFPECERLLTMTQVAERLGFDQDTHKHPETAAKNFCKKDGIGGLVGRYFRVSTSDLDDAIRKAVRPHEVDVRALVH